MDQQRDFLAKCDLLLEELKKDNGNAQLKNEHYRNFFNLHNLSKQDDIDIIGYMQKRKHITIYKGPWILLSFEGKEFARSSTYVSEYDNHYQNKFLTQTKLEGDVADLTRKLKDYKLIKILAWIGALSGLFTMIIRLYQAWKS